MSTPQGPDRSTLDLEPVSRETRREDQDDLAASQSRAEEHAMSYEDFVAKLKTDGTL